MKRGVLAIDVVGLSSCMCEAENWLLIELVLFVKKVDKDPVAWIQYRYKALSELLDHDHPRACPSVLLARRTCSKAVS